MLVTLHAFAFCFSAKADTSLKNDSTKKDSIKIDAGATQKDLKDVVARVAGNHKLPGISDEKKSNKGPIFLSFLPGFGYSEPTGFYGSVSVNASFFANNDTANNLSSINSFVNYTQHNQVILPIISTMWLHDDKYCLTGDWHYYKYPSYSYDLGMNSPLNSADFIDYSYIRFWQTMYRRFSHNVFFGGGYALDYHFNIHDYGMADSTKESAFKKYGQTNSSVSSGFTLNFLYDDRRNPNNPKKGHYLNITYRDNLTLLGSDRNWQSLLIDARKYFRLPGRYGNVLALWSYDWFTLKGTPPFFDLPGIGWDANSNTGRGYVQGRFRGRNMMYFEAEYRFNLTPNGLFGGVIFSNIQSFSEEPDNRFMTVAPGFGGGIRIKFNKYSDTNAAIDYGVGIGGSHGFLFNLCEVF